jgi:hypothetical protein
MASSTPEKEAKFQALKRKGYKSVFAFHGSPLDCWHSIVRTGLKNVSRTTLQTTGAVYGAGIYISPNMRTSRGYSKMRETRAAPGKRAAETGEADEVKYLKGDGRVWCMAICEVIDTGQSIKRHSRDIWTVSDGDHLVTRFLLVWDSDTGTPESYDVRTTDVTLEQEIREAVAKGSGILREHDVAAAQAPAQASIDLLKPISGSVGVLRLEPRSIAYDSRGKRTVQFYVLTSSDGYFVGMAVWARGILGISSSDVHFFSADVQALCRCETRQFSSFSRRF